MSLKTRSALGILAQQVADETAPGANTAERVGDILQDIVDSAPNYISYYASLTQTGTDAPVATVYQALPQGTIVWSRTGAGIYNGLLNGAFPENKVPIVAVILPQSTTTSTVRKMFAGRIDNNNIELASYIDGVAFDDVLNNSILEIRVYP